MRLDAARLGAVVGTGRGRVDAVLAAVARRLADEGWNLAGVVQENPEVPGRRCDMDLVMLGAAPTDRQPPGGRFRISQCLGPMARGCRLDPAGLEAAVGLVSARLETDRQASGPQPERRPDLLIVNKFGKAELQGRGFRPVIARALELDVPVLVGLNGANRDGFAAFAADLAELLPAEPAAVLGWCRDLLRSAA